jgi:hypothetical protein
MKQILTIIICIAILNTSCTQSTIYTTAPNAPNTLGYSIDSNYFFKINLNGQSLYEYGVKENYPSGAPFSLLLPGGKLESNDSTNAPQRTLTGASTSSSNFYIPNASVNFSMSFNKLGISAIGNYDLHVTDMNSYPRFSITDFTGMTYEADSNSTTLTVQNIEFPTLKITGVMSGNFISGSLLIPFTGSFSLRIRSYY